MKSFLIALFAFSALTSFGQRSNEIYLPLCGSYYFNDQPYKLNRLFIINGIAFKRSLGKEGKHGLLFQANYVSTDYRTKAGNGFWNFRSSSNLDAGDVVESYHGAIQLGYFRNLISNSLFKVDAKGLLSYCIESASLIQVFDYKEGENCMPYKSVGYQNTLGLGIGIDLTIPLSSRFYIKSDAQLMSYPSQQKSTYFLQGEIPEMKEPQRNVLLTGIGLAYGFGRRR
jgi:hypothetical protein